MHYSGIFFPCELNTDICVDLISSWNVYMYNLDCTGKDIFAKKYRHSGISEFEDTYILLQMSRWV